MLSEETCENIKALNALKVKSLCLTCSKRSDCSYRKTSDMIGESERPGVRMEHIIGVCFLHEEEVPKVSYRTVSHRGEDAPIFHPNHGNLEPRLREAKVEECCVGCKPEVKSNCDRRIKLDNLAESSMQAGTWVKALVIGCSETNGPHRLIWPSEWTR